MNTYIMESKTEGQRINLKTNLALTMEQLHWANITRGQNVLDVGCAAGTTTRLMAEIVGKYGKAVGIDLSEERLEEAISYSLNFVQTEYRVGNAETIPAKEGEFDVSWARFLFEYLKSPLTVIAEMKRVTRLNGVVIISDLDGNCLWHSPTSQHFSEELSQAIDLLGQYGFDPFVGRKLFGLAHQAGLKDIEVDVRPYHCIVGKISVEVENHWQMKLDTVADTLVKLGWEFERAEALKNNFLDFLRDESTFTYSTLISVKGVNK
jgi:SAM-dependent methyltransferase